MSADYQLLSRFRTGLFRSFLMIFLSLAGRHLPAQEMGRFQDAEEQLSRVFSIITDSPEDAERIREAEHFCILLARLLKEEGSIDYAFPMLPTLSKLSAPDGSFRIYTWNIPLHAGGNRFYGFVQIQPKKRADSARIIPLFDRGGDIATPEDSILTSDRWYGAVYYRLIPEKPNSGSTFYTLLGWRGESLLVSSRIIDILTITHEGQIRFGDKVFCHFAEVPPARIIFRHASGVSMILRYDEQWMVTGKQWNIRKKEFVHNREQVPMIVYDRIIPANPQLEGQPEYNIPAGDVFDGFLFRNGCWNLVTEIDARNPEKK